MRHLPGVDSHTPEKKLPDAVVQNLNVKYGLDQPLYKQYGKFVLNALKGDIGISFQRQDQPVRDILHEETGIDEAIRGLLERPFVPEVLRTSF